MPSLDIQRIYAPLRCRTRHEYAAEIPYSSVKTQTPKQHLLDKIDAKKEKKKNKKRRRANEDKTMGTADTARMTHNREPFSSIVLLLSVGYTRRAWLWLLQPSNTRSLSFSLSLSLCTNTRSGIKLPTPSTEWASPLYSSFPLEPPRLLSPSPTHCWVKTI
jgi:hypothetical protein